MSAVVEVPMEVTTAELAAMSSEALRTAVSRGKRADEFEKELGLVRTMNRMLMEQVDEMKAQLVKEREKRSGRGVAHENARLEEDPEDDELPRLRLANESLMTRQQMLEAQVQEAARYNESIAEDLRAAQAALKAQQEQNERLESKNATLAYDIEVLQASPSYSSPRAKGRMQHHHSHSSSFGSGSTLSQEAVSQLQDEHKELSEKVAVLQQKCESRKVEVKSLRTNVTFLKTKMAELTSKLQTNEAVNDAALQKLKSYLAIETPNSSNSITNDSTSQGSQFSAALKDDTSMANGLTSKLEEVFSICGILDSEQSSLLESASKEISTLLSAINTPEGSNPEPQDGAEAAKSLSPQYSSIRDYFNSKLHQIDSSTSGAPQSMKVTSSNNTLSPINEDSSVSTSTNLRVSGNIPSSNNSSATGSMKVTGSQGALNLTSGSNWHDFDASFIVLAVMLIQKLTSSNERLVKKRREYADLQEDFNEFKRASQTQSARGVAGGSRKMSAETQQITLQKKMIDLEKSVQSLTAASNEKQNQISSLNAEIEALSADVETKKQNLDEAHAKYEESVKVAQQKDEELAAAVEKEQKFKADSEALTQSVAELKAKSDQLSTEVQQLTEEKLKITEEKKKSEGKVSQNEQEISDLKAQIDKSNTDIANTKSVLEAKENEANQLAEDVKEKESKISQLQNEVDSKQKDVERLEKLSKEREEEIKSLKTLSDEKIAELESKSSELYQVSSQVERLATESSTLKEAIESLKSSLESTTADLNLQKKSLAEAQESLGSTRKELESKVVECNNLNTELERIASEAKATKEKLEKTLEETESKAQAIQAELKSQISNLEDTKSDLEAQRNRLTAELEMKSNEAREQVRNLTLELSTLTASKNSEISNLQSSLDLASKESGNRAEKISNLESLLKTSTEECGDLSVKLKQLEDNLSKETKERLDQTSAKEEVERELAQTKEALEQLQTTTAQSIASLEQSLGSIEAERSSLLVKIDEAKRVEENMAADILALQIKAKELEVLQRKIPEIADEALEAEERAATKWLEYTLNKEKATTTNNPFAALATQLSLGTHSPTSALQLAGGAASSGRKITRLADAIKQPSFLASVINLVKKDAFSDVALKKMETMEADALAASSGASPANATTPNVQGTPNTATTGASASNAGNATGNQVQISSSVSGESSTAEQMRSLEECLSVARSIGMKINGVTAALLFQGNRRAIVDLSLEAIRIVTTSRATVRAHPELSLLFIGKDEKDMHAKAPDRVLIKWVNNFVEEFNASHPELTPPRPLVTNLGRDLSDGRALGMVMAGINPDWAPLGEPNPIDLMRKISTALQQASWMRLIPPFLDSALPILRGDETVLTILLAQLLEWNTGLSSPLAKMAVIPASTTTASMLSATTPSRNQVRAVSGANMTDSPLKTPAGGPAKSGLGFSAAAGSSAFQPTSAASSFAPNSATTTPAKNSANKPGEEPSRWKFW